MEEVTSADSPIYRDLMRFKPDGWTANAWAVQAGVSRTVWTDMRRHGNPSRRTLEKLLAAAGSSLAEFEALRLGVGTRPVEGDGTTLSEPSQSWRPAPQLPLPLIASRLGEPVHIEGRLVETTELSAATIVARLPRPAALLNDRDSYAFTVAGETMWPRFRQGRRVVVSPKANIAKGDDLVLILKSNRAQGISTVVLGELVGQAASQVQLRQFNPDVVFSFDADRVVDLHKIVGELI
jgi:phage repressor protein C with HTH and peptisase S24 domain